MTKIRQSQSYEACLCWGFLLPAPAPGAFRWWCLGPTGWYQLAELVDTLLNLPRMSPNWKLASIILVCCYRCYFHGTRVCAVCVHACCALGGVWVRTSTSQHYSCQALFFAVLFTNDSFLNVVPWSVFQLTEVWRSASHWIKITGKHPNTSEHHR